MRNLKPFSLFVFVLALAPERIVIKTHGLKVDVLQDRKIYWLQARPYIYEPGNFSGWGSERVKTWTRAAVAEERKGSLRKLPLEEVEIVLNNNNKVFSCVCPISTFLHSFQLLYCS